MHPTNDSSRNEIDHSMDRLPQSKPSIINSHSLPLPQISSLTITNIHPNQNTLVNISDDTQLSQFPFKDDDETSPEPSPTPLVSDLDDLLADTPNSFIVNNKSMGMRLGSGSFSNNGDTNNSANIIGAVEFYNSDKDNESLSDYNEEDDDDEEPPIPHPIMININNELKIDSADDDENDIKIQFLNNNNNDFRNRSQSAYNYQSWEQICMKSTKNNYISSKRIKCITPITQQMAEMNINRYSQRRRSVANITDSVHKLFKLDPDLLKIRDEYVEKKKLKECDSNHNNDDNNKENENENEKEKEELILDTKIIDKMITQKK